MKIEKYVRAVVVLVALGMIANGIHRLGVTAFLDQYTGEGSSTQATSGTNLAAAK